MPYTPTSWATGTTITPAALTNIETELALLDGRPVVPTVVNGKWLRGVGGAAVWDDITPATVPAAGANSGFATLDSTGKVPLAQLPLRAGSEVGYAFSQTVFGPTGVSSTGNGDALLDIGSVTTENVKYYWEFSLGLISAAAGSMAFRLHEGTPGAVGPLVYEVATATLTTVLPLFFRIPYTPAAGTRNYHLRWRSGAAGSYTAGGATYPIVSRLVKA